MNQARESLAVDGRGRISAVLSGPSRPRWLFAYAPGAGSGIDDPFALHAAEALAGDGIAVLRFQFPYQEQRKRRPDSNQVLEATWRTVLRRAREMGREREARVVAGGRSMGGRIASQVVAAGEPVDALALFAYPLHSPGRPYQLRDDHLGTITVPALFCSGTRDAFATADELQRAAALLRQGEVHILEGADHGFAASRASGRRREDVWQEACQALVKFLSGLRVP